MCMLCLGKGGETAIASIYFTIFDRSHRPNPIRGKKFFRSPIFSRKPIFVIRAALRCPPLSNASHPEVLTWKKKKKVNPSWIQAVRQCSFKNRQSLKKKFKLEENFTQSTSSSSRLDSPFHGSKRLGPWDSGGDLHPSPVPRGVLGERPRNTSALDEINRLNDNFRLSHPCRSALPPVSPRRHFRPPNKINIERGDAITWYFHEIELWSSTFVGRKRNFKRWSASEDTVVWSADPSLYDLKTSAILSPWGQRRPKRQESGFYTAYHD